MSAKPHLIPGNIIVECVMVGAAMRVNAIDPHSGTEVSFQAPRHASKHEIHKVALSKLSYVLNKDKPDR